MFRSLLLFVALLILSSSADVAAQGPPPRPSSAITGTYEQPACGLQAAPLSADSVRVQLVCRRGPPSYHLGILDERLSIRDGVVVYTTRGSGDACQIRIRFGGARAIVTQVGSDVACGFGAGVSIAGIYGRTSTRVPPFDLNPIRDRRDHAPNER